MTHQSFAHWARRTARIAIVVFALAIATAAVIPPASASGEEGMHTVTGSTPPTRYYAPVYVALCDGACFVKDGEWQVIASDYKALTDEEGGFTLSGVPEGTYRFAVDFGTGDDRGKLYRGWGYLKPNGDGTYGVVKDFTQGAAVTVAGDLALGVIKVNPNRRATTTPKKPQTKGRAIVESSGGASLGNSFRIWTVGRASRLTKRMTVKAVLIGCGGRTVARETYRGRTGSYRFQVTTKDNPRIGRSLKVRLTVSEPGRRSFQRQLRIYPAGNYRRSC